MIPKSVKVNKNRKGIQVEYDNDKFLLLSSPYLRSCSPSAANRKESTKGVSPSSFNNVLIKEVEAVGNYAIRIVFDDGHDTGIFSWEYIHELGSKSQNF